MHIQQGRYNEYVVRELQTEICALLSRLPDSAYANIPADPKDSGGHARLTVADSRARVVWSIDSAPITSQDDGSGDFFCDQVFGQPPQASGDAMRYEAIIRISDGCILRFRKGNRSSPTPLGSLIESLKDLWQHEPNTLINAQLSSPTPNDHMRVLRALEALDCGNRQRPV